MPSSPIRNFGDAARAAAGEQQDEELGPPVLIKVLDREIWFEYPSTGQAVFLTAELNDAREDVEQVGGLMALLYELTDEDSARFLRRSLMKKNTGFTGEDVVEMIEFLMEEWSSRPTESVSSSSPSPRTGGRSSTAGARRRASTSSTSRSGGSSTRSTPA